MSPSALSKHVSMIEREFGATFFLRTTSGLQLTREGARFYERISSELGALTNALESARSDFEARGSSLTIAMNRENPGAIKRLLSNVSRVAKLELDTNVEILQKDTLYGLKEFEADSVDFFVVRGASFSQMKRFNSLEIARSRLVCIVDKDSPLASKPSVTFKDDLWNYPLVKLGAPSFQAGWSWIEGLMVDQGINPPVKPLILDSLADLEFLPRLGGALLMPTVSAGSIGDESYSPFVVLPVSEPEAYICINIVWRKGQADASMAGFIDLLEDYLKDYDFKAF